MEYKCTYMPKSTSVLKRCNRSLSLKFILNFTLFSIKHSLSGYLLKIKCLFQDSFCNILEYVENYKLLSIGPLLQFYVVKVN